MINGEGNIWGRGLNAELNAVGILPRPLLLTSVDTLAAQIWLLKHTGALFSRKLSSFKIWLTLEYKRLSSLPHVGPTVVLLMLPSSLWDWIEARVLRTHPCLAHPLSRPALLTSFQCLSQALLLGNLTEAPPWMVL